MSEQIDQIEIKAQLEELIAAAILRYNGFMPDGSAEDETTEIDWALAMNYAKIAVREFCDALNLSEADLKKLDEQA